MRARIQNAVFLSLIWLVLFVLFAGAAPARAAEAQDGDPVYYFYDNPCASCDTEGEFVDLFNEQVGDVKRDAAFRLVMINIFRSGSDRLLQEAERAGVPAEERAAPLVIIKNGFLRGDQEIRNGLRALFIEQFGLEDAPSPAPPAPARTPLGPEAFAPVQTGILYMRYYYRDTCPDCQKVEDLLAEFEKSRPALRFDRLSVENEACRDELYRLFDQFQIPQERREIPAVFWQNGALLCEDVTLENLEAAYDGAAYKDFLEHISAEDAGSGKRIERATAAAAATALLLCAAAVFFRARRLSCAGMKQ